MADVNANIGVNIDTSQALAQLKSLQRQISTFHTSVAKSSEAAAAAQRSLQKNLINNINATGAFAAELRTIKTTSESFTDSLERNKFSMREYFRYAGASTKTFGKLFKTELNTISNVAEERVKRLQTQYIKMGRDASGTMKAIAVMPTALNMEDFGTKAAIAAQKQQLFNQLVRQGSTNLLNFGKNTQWAGRQLMVGFTIPLSILGSTASRVFMDMEAAAIKFKKVYGDLFTPSSETQAALENITALGKTFTRYGIAVSDTVGLAAEAAAAGFAGIDLQRQTTEATRLQVLGQIDAQKALETTISLQNAFGIASADLAQNIDFLNAVENQTVVSLDDITTAIPKVAPVIKSLGGDVKDLAFFLAAMKEGGVNASQGANALKSGLASLINPTEKASAMLQGMGINITKIIEDNKGNLRATVLEFAKALDTLDPLTRARAIEQLFGKFQFARLSTLFNNVIRDGNQASRVLDLASASVEELGALSEQELGITAESSMNKFKDAVASAKAALVPVGETFLQAVTPIIEFVGNILEKFNNLSSGTKKVITLLTVGLGAIGPVLLMTFGLVANGIANLIKLFLTLRNGYLRLAGQTQVLGSTTEYMTMEQLDAAAAAHSLDQAHARLTQQFTVEAAAVRDLTSAYQAATRAGASFAANNPAMMMPSRGVKKFAQGARIVPGSGNKDTVAAMLTPGESVIPKKQTQKYGSLINGIIADNIPGFALGLGTTTTGKVDFAHVTERSVISLGEFITALEKLPAELQQAKSEMITKLREMGQVFGKDLPVNVYSGLGFAQSRELNIGMGRGGAVSASSFLEDFKSRGVEKWSKTLSIGGANLQNVSEELTRYDAQLEAGVQRMLDLNQDATITSEQFAQLEREVRNTLPATSSLRQALDLAEATITEWRINLNKQVVAEAGLTSYQVPSRTGTGMSAKQWVNLETTRVRLGGEHDTRRAFGGLGQMPTRVVDNLINETASAAQTRSPSKRTIEIGKDIARGLQVGMLDQQDEVARTAGQLGNTASGLIDPRTGMPFAKTPTAPTRTSSAMNINELAAKARINREALLKQQEFQRIQKVNASMDRLNRRFMSGMFALTAFSGVASMAGGNLGKFSEILFQITGPMFALSSVLQLLTGSKIVSLISKFKFAFSAGALALGAGVLIINAVNKAREREREQLEKHADAIRNSKEAIESLADYFGIVAQQTPLQSTQPMEILPSKEREALTKLKGSSAFQAKDIQKSIRAVSLMSATEAQQALTIKGLDLLGRGFSKAQVNLILKGIKEEAGKANLDLQFKEITLDESQLKQLTKDLNKSMKDFNTEFNKGFSSKETSAISRTTGEVVRFNQEVTSKKAAAALKNQSTRVATYMNAISGLFANGTINGEKFNKITSSLFDGIIKNAPNATTQIKLLNAAIAQMESPIAKFGEGLNSTSDKLLLIQAAMVGVTSITPAMLEALATAEKSADGGAQRAASRVRRRIKEAIADATALRDAINELIGTGTGTEKKDGFNFFTEMKKRIKELQNETKAYTTLRKAAIDASLAQELASNPDMAKAINAIKEAGTRWKEALQLIKEYNKEKKIAEQTQIALGGQGDYELARLNMAQAYIALQEHLIDMQSAPTLKKYNDQLRQQQNTLSEISAEIQSITEGAFDPNTGKFIVSAYAEANAKIKENNYQLEEISIIEDQINEQYQTQIDALQKIKSINEDIAAAQQSRLTIADALTRGDIAAAAAAIQQDRQREVAARATSAETKLQEARDANILALGRNKIEKENRLLQLEISRIQKEQLDPLEKEKRLVELNIDAIQAKIKALEDFNQKIKDSITYFGMTKEEIDNAAKALDLAKNANIDINDPNFLNNILKAAKGDSDALKLALDAVAKAAKQALADLEALRAAQGLPSAIITSPKGNEGDVNLNPPPDPSARNLPQTAEEALVDANNLAAEAAIAAADAAEAVLEAKTSSLEVSLIELSALQTERDILLSQTNTLSKLMSSGKTKNAQKFIKDIIKRPSGGGTGMLFESRGGLISPRYFASGGFARGSDKIPAMLTPGEFVMNKYAVQSYGVDKMKAINSGSHTGDNMYNYNLTVNVKSDADANEIARTVMTQIRQIDSKKIRGNRV